MNTDLLPPPGRWAVGPDRTQAEALLAAARRAGLRTAWQGRDAGFVSNLSILENLQLLLEWHACAEALADAVTRALAVLALSPPDWLTQRPAALSDAQRRQARLLRLLVLRPEVLVIEAPSRGRAFDDSETRLLDALEGARLLLLGPALPDWPVWPDPASGAPAAP